MKVTILVNSEKSVKWNSLCFNFICRYGGYTFEDEAVGGASDQVKTTVWYNNKGYHSLPSFYSGLSNGILRSRVEAMNKDPTKYGRYP